MHAEFWSGNLKSPLRRSRG